MSITKEEGFNPMSGYSHGGVGCFRIMFKLSFARKPKRLDTSPKL